MGRAKDIRIKPIASKDANRIVKALHYSGKVCQNSQLHFGFFLGPRCGGAAQFGPPLDRRKVLPLVAGTEWNDMLELNRLVLADWLPRNSESRCLGVMFRLMRKMYPNLKWVLSFADGTQCGDGTIYRATGFVLTAIKKNTDLWRLSDGRVVHAQTLKMIHFPGQRGEECRIAPEFMQVTRGKVSPAEFLKAKGITWEAIPGYQLRYIYFLDPTARERLTVPIIPFSEIEKRGAGMYRGKPRVRSVDSDTSGTPAGRGRCNSDPDALIQSEQVGT